MPDGLRLRTWRVEGTLPPDDNRKWAHNLNLIAYAKTLEEVVEAVRIKYPDITFIKIMGDRWAEDVVLVTEE